MFLEVPKKHHLDAFINFHGAKKIYEKIQSWQSLRFHSLLLPVRLVVKELRPGAAESSWVMAGIRLRPTGCFRCILGPRILRTLPPTCAKGCTAIITGWSEIPPPSNCKSRSVRSSLQARNSLSAGSCFAGKPKVAGKQKHQQWRFSVKQKSTRHRLCLKTMLLYHAFFCQTWIASFVVLGVLSNVSFLSKLKASDLPKESPSCNKKNQEVVMLPCLTGPRWGPHQICVNPRGPQWRETLKETTFFVRLILSILMIVWVYKYKNKSK